MILEQTLTRLRELRRAWPTPLRSNGGSPMSRASARPPRGAGGHDARGSSAPPAPPPGPAPTPCGCGCRRFTLPSRAGPLRRPPPGVMCPDPGARIVLITGAAGTGKTYFACHLAQAAFNRSDSTRYYRLPRLLGELDLPWAAGSYPRSLDRLAITPTPSRSRARPCGARRPERMNPRPVSRHESPQRCFASTSGPHAPDRPVRFARDQWSTSPECAVARRTFEKRLRKLNAAHRLQQVAAGHIVKDGKPIYTAHGRAAAQPSLHTS